MRRTFYLVVPFSALLFYLFIWDMASSISQHHPTFGDPPTTSFISTPQPTNGSPSSNSQHSISNNRSNGKTWAQIAAKQRHSLMHTTHQRNSGDSSGTQLIISHVWKPGRSPGSMFFDVSGCNITQLDIMILIAEQYPSRIAVVPFSQGPKKLVEVNFVIDDPAYKEALEKGISVKTSNVTVIPCVAMDPSEIEANIIRLSLSRLPLLPEQQLLEGLKTNLSKYGTIIDTGIIREPKTQTYMGTGYAILTLNSKVNEYAPLTHIIPWNNTDTGFHATWTDMPPWCRYCHQEGHIVSECPHSNRRQQCWNCSELGHKAAMCPRGNYGKRLRKTAETPTITPLNKQKKNISNESTIVNMESTSGKQGTTTLDNMVEISKGKMDLTQSIQEVDDYTDILAAIEKESEGLDKSTSHNNSITGDNMMKPVEIEDITTIIDDDEVVEDTTPNGQPDKEMDNNSITTSDSDHEMEDHTALKRSTVTVNGVETQLSNIHQSAALLQQQQSTQTTTQTTPTNIPIRRNPTRNAGRPAKYQ
jgi:hypothetical protein